MAGNNNPSVTLSFKTSGVGSLQNASQNVQSSLSGVARSAGQAKSALGGVAQSISGFGRSAVGSAGLGPVGALLTAGSISAVVGAIGTIVGQSIRMAYEFEKSATRAAQSLSIGTGPNLQSNITMLKNAAAQGLAYNISSPEMMKAITTYGSTSGVGVQQSAQAARGIGIYSRAYGLDPAEVATIVGQVTAISGKDFDSEAKGVFGAAEDAGNLGRRLPEFIGLATSTLASLQAADARGNYSGADAAALVANIAKGGGFFNTSAGVAAYQGAASSLIGGISQSPGGIAFGVGAGISPEDIRLERNNPENQRKALLYAAQLARGASDRPMTADQLRVSFENVLMARGISPDNTRTLVDRFYQNGRPVTGSLEGAINSVQSTKTSSQSDEVAKALTKFGQYKQTEFSQYEHLFAEIQNKELQLGETILDKMKAIPSALEKILNGDYLGGIKDLIGSNEILRDALIAAAASQLLGGGLGKGILGNLLKFIPGVGGGALAGLGAVLTAGVIGGVGMAMIPVRGGDEYDGDDNYFGSYKRSGLEAWAKRNMKKGLPWDQGIPKTLADRMRASSDLSTNALLAGITGPEGNSNVENPSSGALGIYQMLPTTAYDYMRKFDKDDADFDTSARTLTYKGKQKFLGDVNLQSKTAAAYIQHLREYAASHGFDPNDPRVIAGAYYAGETHMGQDEWVAGQDQAGNTNHLHESEYEDSMMTGFAKYLKTHAKMYNSDGSVITYTPPPKKKMARQSAIAGRSSHR